MSKVKVNFDETDPLETLGMSPEDITAAGGGAPATPPPPAPNAGEQAGAPANADENDALEKGGTGAPETQPAPIKTEPEPPVGTPPAPATPAPVKPEENKPAPAPETKPEPPTVPAKAPEGAKPAEGASANAVAASQGKDDAEAIKMLNDALGLNVSQIKTDTAAIKAEAEKSGMSVEEKAAMSKMIEDLNAKSMEKDELIKELQNRYTAQETRLGQVTNDNENMKMDNVVNKKVMDKYESDPKMQEYFALKTKADNGNENAKAKLEDFHKNALSESGYDMDTLIANKKNAEKKALSSQSAPAGSNLPNKNFNDGDALENL